MTTRYVARSPIRPPGRCVGHKFPLAPLEAIYPNPIVLADAIGCAPRRISMWRKSGIWWKIADDVAGRLGMGPWEIWPDWFDWALEDSG